MNKIIFLIFFVFFLKECTSMVNPLSDYDVKSAPDGAEHLKLFGSDYILKGKIFNPYDTLEEVPVPLVPKSGIRLSDTIFIPAYNDVTFYLSSSTKEMVLNQSTYWSYVNETHGFNIVPQFDGTLACYISSNYNWYEYEKSLNDYRRAGSVKLENMKGSAEQLKSVFNGKKNNVNNLNHKIPEKFFSGISEEIADYYLTYGTDVMAPGMALSGCQNQLVGVNIYMSRLARVKYGISVPYLWTSASYYPFLNQIGLSSRNIIQSVNIFENIYPFDSSSSLSSRFLPPSCLTPLDWCRDLYNQDAVIA